MYLCLSITDVLHYNIGMAKYKFPYKYKKMQIGEIIRIPGSQFPAICVEQEESEYSTIKTPNILYHYCPSSSFKGIINSKTIWLSSLKNTNDYTEMLHLFNIFIQYLKSQKFSQNEQRIINVLYQGYQHNLYSSYASSFSCLKDKLGQWRGYSEDGTGFSIGFDTSKMNLYKDLPKRNYMGDCNISLLKVLYKEKEQKKVVKEMVKKALETPKEIYSIALYLSKISCICKAEAYSEEQEWRILYTPLLQNNPDLQKAEEGLNNKILLPRLEKECNGKNLSYFPYKLSDNVIKEIIIGPKNSISESEVVEILKNSNIEYDIDVKKSKVPYR